ncbi:MAG: benzoate-CoA ligase family protein [Acidobacteriia bacterium]|nr:benzoate-CoA ligase family protein [Terriglobia bacterium]
MVRLPTEFNVATHFVDRHVEEGRGDKIAILCGDARISYADLLARTNRVGNAIRDLDVRPEERVLLLLLDGPEFLYCFFGAIKAGAVVVPINTLLKPEEYEYLFNDTRARVLFVGHELLPKVSAIPKERLKFLRDVVVVGEQQAGALGFDDLVSASSPDLAAAPTRADDAAFWLYSSGSTGAPKGCVHLHHDMVVSTEHYAKAILKMDDRDRCYSVARLFFAYGLGNAGYFPLGVGATTILSPRPPSPATIYANIERYRPTLFFSVPTNYAALLSFRREPGSEFDLSSIRHAVSAGEALPAALYERFKARFGIEILDALGSTETLHMVLSNRPGEVRPGSSGQVLPGFEARIVDEKGSPVPRGQIGNLMVKADSTCAGYWNHHEKTKNTFEGHWYRTGDKYHQDEDDYFWYAGRADDLFKVSGSWLSPVEVEAALVAHPSVREAAVVGREDDHRLLRPAAYVVLEPNALASDELARQLKAWVGQRLAAYKEPRWIEFVADLPKTATGKLQRFRLREAYAAKKAD